MGFISIGVDIGQKNDNTAIAVVELDVRGADEWGAGGEDFYLVRHLERLPLETPYPDVAEYVAGIVRKLQAPRQVLHGYSYRDEDPHTIALSVDATGVGQPVVDILKRSGVDPVAVYFTHGDRRKKEDRYVSLGKAWLVSRLVALMQTKRIKTPDTPEVRAMVKELQNYEIRVDENANDKYGAFKTGTHDDLVTALGLAVQADKPGTVEALNPELVHWIRASDDYRWQ